MRAFGRTVVLYLGSVLFIAKQREQFVWVRYMYDAEVYSRNYDRDGCGGIIGSFMSKGLYILFSGRF